MSENRRFLILIIICIGNFLTLVVWTGLAIAQGRLGQLASKSGPLGDTVGGIVGPILTAFAGFYAWRAYEEQKKTNQLQNAELARQSAIHFTTILKAQLDTIPYHSPNWFGMLGILAVQAATTTPEMDANHEPISGPVNARVIIETQLDVYNQLADFLTEVARSWDSIMSTAIYPNNTFEARLLFVQLLEYYVNGFYPTQAIFHETLSRIKAEPTRKFPPAEELRLKRFIIIDRKANSGLDQLEKLQLIQTRLIEDLSAGTVEAVKEEKIDLNLITRAGKIIVNVRTAR